MTTERITIDKHEDKTSQGGKDYCRFSTNLGWLSCFEKDVIDELKKLPTGHSIEVEVATSEKNGQTFKNIRNVYPNSKTDQPTMDIEPSKPIVQSKVTSPNTTMYVSYVKDLVVSGIELDKAITIINTAKQAFS